MSAHDFLTLKKNSIKHSLGGDRLMKFKKRTLSIAFSIALFFLASSASA